MSSIKPIRDPKTDHLLTPENSALLVIDYQPIQVHSITSMDRQKLVENISNVCRIAKGFNVPIVLTTVKDYPTHRRKVCFWDEEQKRKFTFLTNAIDLSPLQIAEHYKKQVAD